MLERNGDSAAAHLVARIDELLLSLDRVTRELQETWAPRLLAVERDVDALLHILRPRETSPTDAGDEQ